MGSQPLDVMMAPDASWVSRSVITDPDVYAQEQKSIFQRCWLVVAHESQIPASGDFVSSWMGEESVIVSRGRDGSIHVLLNSCSHRASRICRVDSGNAQRWTCINHGWQFANDGRLIALPQITDGYDDDNFDRASMGLLQARVATRFGLIFATFDPDPPSLDEYLGDAAFYLETIFGRYKAGVQVLGTQKSMVASNWKLVAENLGTDLQHPEAAHGSFMELWPDPVMGFLKSSEQIITSAGHPMCIGRQLPPFTEPEAALASTDDPAERREIEAWFARSLREAEEILGPTRAGLYLFTGNVFPNFSFLPGLNATYLCHPRGPLEMEWWSWCIVPADAPPAVKRAMRQMFSLANGPAGLILAEDTENWADMTRASASAIGSRLRLHIGRGLGLEYKDDDLPGVFAPMRSEHAQRAFWLNWRRAMDRAE